MIQRSSKFFGQKRFLIFRASIVAPAILTKMNNKVPHVSMQAITVLDACINNCGSEFQKMVASSVSAEKWFNKLLANWCFHDFRVIYHY